MKSFLINTLERHGTKSKICLHFLVGEVMNHGGLISYYFANSSIQDYVGKKCDKSKALVLFASQGAFKGMLFIFFQKKKKKKTKLDSCVAH